MMHHYHNLLYVSHATSDETEALKQALSLARNNNAKLAILIITPEFPTEFPDYQKKYEAFLKAEMETSIKETKAAIKLDDEAIDIKIELSTDETPAVKIIQHVLQNGHDLVIKEVETQEKKTGFKATDMDLLRKCPVPVWLCRPILHSRQDIQVAVAIDPESEESAAEALSKRLLELSRALADSCSGELHIISCWDYALEKSVRGNVWLKVPDEEIEKSILQKQHEHHTALTALIKASGIQGSHHIHHLRGEADQQIPDFIQNKKIDILVMGTVARTGIPGFIIGNTAENILQKLSCSLMALKPQGFVSPVKAY